MGEPNPQSPPDSFDALIARADKLTRHFEDHPNATVRKDVMELLQAVDGIHRDAIGRFVELILESGNHELIHRAAEDPKVRTLLQLYDIMPVPEAVQWEEMLDTLRPALAEHHADIELLRVDDGMPTLRLKGTFATEESVLRQSVQDAIAQTLGGYHSLKWESRAKPPDPARFVSIEAIRPAKRQIWFDIATADEVVPGEPHKLEVEGMHVLLCRSGSSFHAYPNVCPGTALPLHMGRISGNTLVCAWHGCVFLLETGKRTKGVGKDLSPFTLRIEGGHVQISLWK